MLRPFADCVLTVIVVTASIGSCAEPISPGGGNAVIWRVPSGVSELPLVPAANMDRSMIYFATPDHRVKKIRGSDGNVVWDVPLPSTQVASPGMGAVLSGGVVAISLVDIFAFDTTTGQRRWTYAPPNLEETGDHPLAANDTTIFAASLSGRVHAINAKTGTARWIVDLTEATSHHVGALNPSIDGDLVFVCTRDYDALPPAGKFWALDAITGVVRWSRVLTPAYRNLGSSCYGSAATWHDLVIQPAEDGRIYAMDRATGEVRWIAPMVPKDSANAGNDHRWAAVGGDVVVATSVVGTGSIVVLDAASGTERWRHTEFGGSLFVPAVDASVAYVDHGWVFASYDLQSGVVRWANPATAFSHPQTPYKGTPIISSDRIFVAGSDASYALRR